MGDLKPGTVVLHPEFGSGIVLSNNGEHIEVQFKLRGKKKLLVGVASEIMTVTGFKPTTPARNCAASASRHDSGKLSGKARKRQADAKAQKKAAKRKKRGKAKAQKKGLSYGSHAGRAGGDRWEWDMTTPNTPLYRRGR